MENKDKTKNVKTSVKEAPSAKKTQVKPSTSVQLKESKSEIKNLKEKIKNLEKDLQTLEIEKVIEQEQFKAKAKTFESKAKEQIENYKQEIKDNLSKKELEFKKYAIEPLVKLLISPLLNLKLAISAGRKQEGNVKNYVIGFDMLVKQIEDAFHENQIKSISPKVGDEFNPNMHEALSVIEDSNNTNKILKIKTQGFKLHDRVLKPAIVVIGK